MKWERVMTKMLVGCCFMAAGAAVAASLADEIARENAHSEGRTVIAGKGDVQIALDRSDAQYKCGEEAVFTITVKSGETHPASSLLRSSLRSGDMLPRFSDAASPLLASQSV